MESLATPEDAFAAAVQRAGSQVAFARLVGKKQSTISLRLKKRQPAAHDEVITIERELGISRHVLRPDLHPPEFVVASARHRDASSLEAVR
jgi:DNA-binding transcriptional regulator YdaS (Cro superfamily)